VISVGEGGRREGRKKRALELIPSFSGQLYGGGGEKERRGRRKGKEALLYII